MNISDERLGRSAGILLHISSLPGIYPIGDFGPGAFRFVKKLRKAGQKYWQILPLNPLDSSKGYSPYSPLSAFAGNPLFISPEVLVKKKYLKNSFIINKHKSSAQVDYDQGEKIKKTILREAFNQFTNYPDKDKLLMFHEFCEREATWLNDYALYSSLRNKYELPWYNWASPLRDRNPVSLEKEKQGLAKEIEYEKFVQFLFTEQWTDLKKYCHKQNIHIVGDIPIYISHDSADVWAHPEFFKLTPGKAIRKNAGVPPDYFNSKGQLWNMPVYNWLRLAKSGYTWWIDRLKKNLELYDIVRLDHFRGFSSYWEVDGRAEDAIHGAWIKGPGEKLLNVIQKEFPEMPFIAEDLGDIDQAVFDLRDKYKLPGMRILQFAFEGNMPKSIFISHNYTPNSIVYTGTHDNNTIRGWYAHELSKKGKKNLNSYFSSSVKKSNAHTVLIREAYRSVAKMAIIPMQDVLGLGMKHRMNFPSTETGNWLWRLRRNEFGKNQMNALRKLSELYGRG